MSKESMIIFAFVFNFFLPGLGFHYSGTRHNLSWLRRLGLVTMIVFLFAFPLSMFIFSPYARLNYHFTWQELAAYLTVIFVFAFLGAGIERKIGGSASAHVCS
jgi:uncharacterized membrane protein